MLEENKWVCITRDYFASWTISLPFNIEHREQEITKTLQFTEEAIEIGNFYKIFTIESSSLSQRGAPNINYLDQIKWLIENKQELPFFGGIYGLSKDAVVNTGEISYHYNDEIVTKQCSNLLDLMTPRKNYHKFHPYLRRGNHVSPVEIYSSDPLSLTRDYPRPSKMLTAIIELHSDIWFPEVLNLGNLSDDTLFWKDAELVDNSELANIHTPRLNQCLQALRNLTLEYEGIWYQMDASSNGLSIYDSMLTETGIKLDS